MHNICFKQDVLSLSFNDSSYLFNHTFETNPQSLSPKCCICCCCCCCCASAATDTSMCNNRLASLNPSFLCKGVLSQSTTFIQSSFCKRLIYFHGKSRPSHGKTSGVSSFSNLDRSFYHQKLSSFKEKPKQERLVKGGYEFRRKKQFLSNVSEDNVEVMLSLLTNEVGLECIDGKKKKNVNEVGLDYIDVCDGKKKKNAIFSRVAKRDLKCDEVVKVRSMEEEDDDCGKRKERRKKKMQTLPKTANLDSSKEGLNGCIEGGKDFEVKSEGCIDEVVQECGKEKGKTLEKKDTVKGYFGESVGVSQDWRKKSEKKLNEDQPNVCVNMDDDSSMQKHSYEEDDRFTCESGSRMKYKRFKETSEKDHRVTESTSSSKKQYNDTEKKLNVISEVSKSRMNSWEENSAQVSNGVKDGIEEKHQKTDHLITLTTGSKEKSQQMLEISNTHLIKSEKNTSFSHRKSDAIMEGITDEGVLETESRKSHEVRLVNEEGEQEKLKTTDDRSERTHQKDNGTRHSHHGSGPKGPSDEMWHVTDTSTQEPSEPDAPENTSYSTENDGANIKTGGRSLWTIIGDVVRLRWSSPRSAKGSSYPSASSEAWFSSQEPESSNTSTKVPSRNQVEGLDSPLPSSNTSFAVRVRRSPAIKKTSEAAETVIDQPVSDVVTEMSQADESKRGKMVNPKIGELERRKLVSMDGVGWEEAYTLESQQRKNDEKFMREALLEAKKGADIWEVPVGAVLVQGDRIIARGHNLVEELHDSTAHAEMICIREASTNLRSWRLLDTTLYVTLEPCPMCAGAILQARINTIVWGAPNKLLGADGSWIRGEHGSVRFGFWPAPNRKPSRSTIWRWDGGNGSMPTDMPPAPVHPFHPNVAVRRGVLAAECGEVMQQFFQLRRKRKTEPEPEKELPTPPLSHHHHSNFFSKMHHAFNVIFCL
ncbi:hypothetical protein OSB04_018114 [Centaurea solstitialis]|uniref:tRNA(adenine(34)) deaminase n=1 Tax=Centaurea solstitialis TaxID=347529 RepID=A0AA38T464_9ASTR|nr:hypothetical protein OSB04_018114 [Centaurea solstitialis]